MGLRLGTREPFRVCFHKPLLLLFWRNPFIRWALLIILPNRNAGGLVFWDGVLKIQIFFFPSDLGLGRFWGSLFLD